MDMPAYTPVEFVFLETLAEKLIVPARQHQFIQETFFNNAPVPRIAIAMNTNSVFTGSYTENPIWYQHFDLRRSTILRGGQPIVDFDAIVNCCLYGITIKAMNFEDGIHSFPIDSLNDHYVILLDLTLMQVATEKYHYQELVGEPLTLKLNFTYLLEHVSDFVVSGERMSSVAVDKFGAVGKSF